MTHRNMRCERVIIMLCYVHNVIIVNHIIIDAIHFGYGQYNNYNVCVCVCVCVCLL